MPPGSVGFDSHTTHSRLEFPPDGIMITNRSVSGMAKPTEHRRNEMKTIQTAIITIAITLAVIAGTMGFAVAGSNMNYDVDFSGVGTGSMQISTFSPVGTDVQIAGWTNCDVVGNQDAHYNDGTWMTLNRDTTVTGLQNGDPASGSILTQSRPTTPVVDPLKSAVVQVTATYADDDAYGSYIGLVQDVRLYDSDMPVVDDAGDERAYVNSEIDGYAYGPGALLTGTIDLITDGSLTAATGVSVLLNDGNLDMDAQARITDNTVDRESAKVNYNIDVTSPGYTADGNIQGYASVNGAMQESYIATFENADMTATGYFYAVTV